MHCNRVSKLPDGQPRFIGDDYRLSPAGHVIGIELLKASTDHEACKRAHAFLTAEMWHAMELWKLGRKLVCSDFKL